MTEREALKQLLEALDKELPHNMKHIAAGQRFNARTALAQPERHELQAKGEHPAPCARHCEATAFQIEIRRLKAKLAQPEQEPHGWYIDGYGSVIGTEEPKSVRVGEWLPWYTTPPQRTWVGLTDEDKAELDAKYGDDTLAHLDAIEAKLKEKNT